jgi:mRNA-degrading endonuclease toxin of MazEF toxin-antitoxin module
VDRGDVHLIDLQLTDRVPGNGTVVRRKYVVALRGGQDAAWEADVPVVIASTDRGAPRRPYEVAADQSDGFEHDTVIDCRWVHTVPASRLPRESYQFTLGPERMHEISVALVDGLQLW